MLKTLNNKMDSEEVLYQVLEERRKQDQKWGEQNHPPEFWLTILSEEVGEVAKAILEGSAFNYLDELVQVAAVAVAAIEAAHRNKLEFVSITDLQQKITELERRFINVSNNMDS